MRVIWAIPIIASILIFSLVLSQNAEALKSEGNPLTEVSSKKVCGLSLCDEPMSIAEKIALFYQKLSGGESTVLQQAIDPRLMDPLKVKPGTMPLRESLSIKQLEQAKVREVVPITPSKIPSAQSSTGRGSEAVQAAPQLGPSTESTEFVNILGPPVSLPCLSCIITKFIAPGAVGASEIAANAVGASEIAANAVGASEIAANAVGKSELNMSISAYTVTNNGGSKYVEKSMVVNNGKNFCMLVKVKMENVDAGGEYAECDIDYGGKSKWLLQAILGEKNNDANVSCQAVCISYG